MYSPDHFKLQDYSEIVSFAKKYSFATIVTVNDNFQTATHLPFILEEINNELYLVSHFARANDQWKELQTNKVLVIFSEPHAYISPKNYDSELNVPTWNYLSVQMYGEAEIITSEEGTTQVLKDMVLTYESSYLEQWNSLPEKFRHNLMKGIVAFRIKVTQIQGKKKASQNRSESEKEKIAVTLKNSNNAIEQEMAKYI